MTRGDCGKISESAYSALGPLVLRRLGVDVYAPLQHSRSAYEQLLPAASPCGYFAALQTAFGKCEAKPGDDDDQLSWLADHLQLDAPSAAEPSRTWARAWDEATAAIPDPAPDALGPVARRVLIHELLRLPDYERRLADALVQALRVELTTAEVHDA